MLTVDFDSLTLELTEGTIKHVGAPDAAATVKCYDVEDVEARAFGDERIKVAVADGEGNEVELALCPEAARTLGKDLERLEAESGIFE